MLRDIAKKAGARSEIEARLERFLQEGTTPSPAVIRIMREWLGLSQSQLATLLGFSDANGDRTIYAFEIGTRNGTAFAPTPSIAKLMRALVAARLADNLITTGRHDDAQTILRNLVPAHLRKLP